MRGHQRGPSSGESDFEPSVGGWPRMGGRPGWVAPKAGLILNLIWERCRGGRRFARAEAQATVGRQWGHPTEMLAVTGPAWFGAGGKVARACLTGSCDTTRATHSSGATGSENPATLLHPL
jgi:hypothetical protein